MKYHRALALSLSSMLVSIGLTASALAQSSGGCVVEQAARAALDRQIKSIEAAQTDVSSFFQGKNSCINSNLLDIAKFDFSKFMVDPFNLVQQIGQQQVNQLLNQAVQKACDIANEQIQNVTGKLNTSLSSWNSGLDDQIRNIISDGQVRLQ